MGETVRTFCRICEAHCGLTAEVEGDRVVAIRPDKAHPVSEGYACVKGLALGAMHHDEQRVNHPLKRVEGGYERISWAQALDEIGRKVKAIRKAHGSRAIGHYAGNPTYFSFQHVLFSSAFLEALDSPNHFASHSIDVNPKFDVSTLIYGLSIVHPVPDFDRTDLFICLGSNPVVSQMSVLLTPNAIGRLQSIEARGGRVVIVDPRRTETAAKVGEHLPIVPGTDVYLLLAMLHHIAHERNAVDVAALSDVARGVEAFVEAARPWTPERAARLTRIDAATIRELAGAFLEAKGAVIYMSTGVNMGPFGSLSYWVLQGLHLVAGHLDSPGGLVVPRGAFDAFRLAKTLGLGTADDHRTLVSGLHRVAGAFPVAALPEEITNDHPERIRALFVSAGNPVHSVPGTEMEEAFDELELLVSIDIFQNETAARADYVLPATDMLERSDFPVSHTMLQDRPHAQFTEAVVPPAHERRPEWRIFSDLALACGASLTTTSVAALLPRLNRWLGLVGGKVTPETLLSLLLWSGGQVTLKQLRESPGGLPLAAHEPGSFLGQRVFTPDRKVHLDAPRLLADLPRLDAHEKTLLESEHDGRLFLVGRRERKSHNSWMHSVDIPRPKGHRALLHPDDAEERGLEDGAEIEVVSDTGSATIPVRLTDDVARGVLVVPHGWGHGASGVENARRVGGTNVNRLIPGGVANVEPVSGQSVMLAHRVTVRSPVADTSPRR